MPKKRGRQPDIEIQPLTVSNEIKNSPHPDLPSTVLRGVIVGNSGSGKSVLLQNLFGKKELYGGIFREENMVIMSPTLDVFDPFPMLENAYKVKDKNKFISTLTDLLDHVKKMSREYGPARIPPICVIIDDCSVEPALFRYNGIVDEFFLTGRNYNISTVVVAHRLNLLSRNVKLNLNFACLFPCVNYSEVESFVIQFCSKENKDYAAFALDYIFRTKYNFACVNTEKPQHEQLSMGFHRPILNDKEIRAAYDDSDDSDGSLDIVTADAEIDLK